ncbi:MAG: hypothetical protein J0M12_15195 [Deltaproteobacteria bacterium]|nr:hypothetical protein [Deltaproteobacteria bacterium]
MRTINLATAPVACEPPYRGADHESVLGPIADRLPELGVRELQQIEPELVRQIRAWGLDPHERRLVDMEGATATLQRICNPEASYFSPGLLLIPGASRLTMNYPAADSPLVWDRCGTLAIFRDPSGFVHVASALRPQQNQEISAHLGARVSVDVWSNEIEISCTNRGRALLTLTINRGPHGLFAYGHGA